MKVRITAPLEYANGTTSENSSNSSSSSVSLKAYLLNMHAIIEYENKNNGPNGSELIYEAVIDPGYFRKIEDEGKKLYGGNDGTLCHVEVLSLSVIQDTTTNTSKDNKNTAQKNNKNEDSDNDDDDEDNDIDDDTSNNTNTNKGTINNIVTSVQSLSLNNNTNTPAVNAMDAATLASAKGTGMMVRRVTQPGKRLTCNACSIEFSSPEEHREHHRSDLHRFNLKRKVKNLEPLSLDAFEAMPAKQRDAFLEMDV